MKFSSVSLRVKEMCVCIYTYMLEQGRKSRFAKKKKTIEYNKKNVPKSVGLPLPIIVEVLDELCAV